MTSSSGHPGGKPSLRTRVHEASRHTQEAARTPECIQLVSTAAQVSGALQTAPESSNALFVYLVSALNLTVALKEFLQALKSV